MMHAQSADAAALEAELQSHAIHRTPEPGRALGTHPLRHTFRGYNGEARLAVSAALSRPVPGGRTLVVIARPRSGTTLLMNLIGQVPGIRAHNEVLAVGRAMPLRYLRNYRRRCREPVLAYKILSYQLMLVQGVKKPVAFLQDLAASGAQFVHLRRDTRDVTVSLVRGGAAGTMHMRQGAAPNRDTVRLDPDWVVARARWNAAYLDFEDRLMTAVPHLRLDYAEALASAEAHQPTIDRICAFIGRPSGPVAAEYTKVGERVRLENRSEIDAALAAEGY